jgi:flagellar hook-length control protein FliK
VNASRPDPRGASATDPHDRASAAKDDEDDDTAPADPSSGGAAPGSTLPTPPLVALNLAAPSADTTTTTAPADGMTEVPEERTVPGNGAPAATATTTTTETDGGQQAAAPSATLATVPTAGSAIDRLELPVDQADGSEDAQPTPAAHETSADAVAAEGQTAKLTNRPSSLSADAMAGRAQMPEPLSGAGPTSSGAKPAASDQNQSSVTTSQTTDATRSTSTRTDPSAPVLASTASSASDQARTMIKAALAARESAQSAGGSAASTGPSSSAPNNTPVANQSANAAPATVPIVTATGRSTSAPPPPPADDSAASVSASARDSAALLSAAIARTQSGESNSPGAHGGDARGQANTGTSGGASTAAGATLASGASPLGASFSLPFVAAGQAGLAGAPQGSGLTPQAEAALPGQIVQAIRMQWQNGVGQATIKLDPAHLGELSVSLRVDQGTVSAQLHADTPEVRAWIQQHAHDLRGSLEQQGLRLGQMTVRAVDPDGRRQQSAQDQPPPRAHRTTVDAGARFAVQV